MENMHYITIAENVFTARPVQTMVDLPPLDLQRDSLNSVKFI